MAGSEHEEGCALEAPDRRVPPRFPVDEDSVLLLVQHGLPLKARIADLSLEGCRLRTQERLNGRPGLAVEITFKVNGCAFRFSGVLRWNDGQGNLGVQFVNRIARRSAELAEVIEELAEKAAGAQAERSASAIAKPREPAPPQTCAADTAEPGVAAKETALPLRGLPEGTAPVQQISRQNPPHVPPPAEAPRQAEQYAHPVAGLRERRAHGRHDVDTSAVIYLVKTGTALRGRIVDLSLSGCRIQTGERFPVGIYTRVETEFQLQGLPFRLGGVIQSLHNRDTVGIRFLDVSQRKRQQVLELIGEIEEKEMGQGEGEKG